MIKVVMPQLSLSMRFGTVTKWYFSEGDFVKQGVPICEIEGDKAVIELEAPGDGILLKILATEMAEFPVKETMAYIGKKDEIAEELRTSGIPASEKNETVTTTFAVPAIDIEDESRGKASPVARRVAEELGVDISKIKGTGPDGIINKNDVLAAKDAMDKPVTSSGEPVGISPAVYSQIRLSGIKKIVAERIKESYLDAPHIELVVSVDMLNAQQMREMINQNKTENQKVTYSDILICGVAKTLKNHNLVNASIQEDTISLFADINIGLATDTEKGLVVPVIWNADRAKISEIASRRHELVDRAKTGKQRIDDLSGGTFTITNLGMFGIEVFKPIITNGQSAILGVGAIKNTPVADETGKVLVHPLMVLSLVCDHRVVNGVDGARFLSDLKALLENPTALQAIQ